MYIVTTELRMRRRDQRRGRLFLLLRPETLRVRLHENRLIMLVLLTILGEGWGRPANLSKEAECLCPFLVLLQGGCLDEEGHTRGDKHLASRIEFLVLIQAHVLINEIVNRGKGQQGPGPLEDKVLHLEARRIDFGGHEELVNIERKMQVPVRTS